MQWVVLLVSIITATHVALADKTRTPGSGVRVDSEFTIINSHESTTRRGDPVGPVGARGLGGLARQPVVKYGWKLGASDPVMQAYAAGLLKGGRECGNGHRVYRYSGWPEVRLKFVRGGDRLARYFIHNYEAADESGFADAKQYVHYAAYTGSDAALEYLTRELRIATGSEDTSAVHDVLMSVASLRRAEIIDDVVDVLSVWPDTPHVRKQAVVALRALIDFTEVDRTDVVDLLREVEWDEGEAHDVRKTAWASLNRFEFYGLMERREYPPEFGTPRPYPARLIAQSRGAEKHWIEQHPKDVGPKGCVKWFKHCGLVDWAIAD